MANKALLWMLLSLVTAACGGGGGGSGIDPRLTRLEAYEVQRVSVLGDPSVGVEGMTITPDAAMPVAGQAVFQGAATILIEQPDDNLALAGDMTLTVSFDNQTAAGAVTKVFGGTSSGGLADFAGSLSLTGVVTTPSFPLDYAGTLTGDNQTLSFAGTLAASVLGDPVEGLAALDLEAEIDAGGVPRTGAIVLFGEGNVTSPPPEG